jgi:hypothetical protein
MPAFLIASRSPEREREEYEAARAKYMRDVIPLEQQMGRPKMPSDWLHREPQSPPFFRVDWLRLRVRVGRFLRFWRRSMIRDVCQLHQDPGGGFRTWSGGGFKLSETGAAGWAEHGVQPWGFMLFDNLVRHIATLRERPSGWGKINHLVGVGSDHTIFSVEVRDRGEVFLMAEDTDDDDEEGCIKRQEAARIERDRATGIIVVPAGNRF